MHLNGQLIGRKLFFRASNDPTIPSFPGRMTRECIVYVSKLPRICSETPVSYQVKYACGKNNFSFVFTVFRRYFRGGANTMGSFLSHLSSVPYIGNLCVRKDMVVYETCRMMCAKKCLCESDLYCRQNARYCR